MTEHTPLGANKQATRNAANVRESDKWAAAFLRRLSLLQRETNIRASVAIDEPLPGVCQCGAPEFSCGWCEA